jgi:hypothetical protein
MAELDDQDTMLIPRFIPQLPDLTSPIAIDELKAL